MKYVVVATLYVVADEDFGRLKASDAGLTAEGLADVAGRSFEACDFSERGDMLPGLGRRAGEALVRALVERAEA